MINIPKIPKLPSREELEFKEKTFLIEVLDQLRSTKKIWFILLPVVMILSWPATALIRNRLTVLFISRQIPLAVGTNGERPVEITVVETAYLPVSQGIYSLYAHVVNPNPNWSAWGFDYEFAVNNAAGEEIKTSSGQSFILPGSSRFIIEPAVALTAAPDEISLHMSSFHWTQRQPEFDNQFAVLQQRWGDENGKFFVEGSVKNPYSFRVSKIAVEAIVFDSAGRRILAVNRTVASDLMPFEQRYFRMLWPVPSKELFTRPFGQIEVKAAVNPLEPGFEATETEPIPAR